MTFCLYISAGSFVIALLLVCFILYAGNPKNHMTTVGTLITKYNFKNQEIKGRIIKNITDYTYGYTVKEKQYRLSMSTHLLPKHIHPKAEIHYLRLFPRKAWLGQYTGAAEKMLALVFFVNGIVWLFLYFWI